MTDPLEDQLLIARPAPPAAFRGTLRRSLLARRPGAHRPAHLWRTASAWAAAGVILLVVALLLAV